MSNKYSSYENKIFPYSYPYSWDRRNKVYLRLFEDRPIYKDYMLPLVFRLRFYSEDYEIISDDFYTPSHNTIRFPIPEDIPGKRFVGWKFFYRGDSFVVTLNDYKILNDIIVAGADDIKLFAVYE